MALFRGNLKYSDVTAKADFLNRRQIIAGAAGIGAAPFVGGAAQAAALKYTKTKYAVDAETTAKSDATGYNNYYEFGTDKSDPAKNAGQMKTDPWSVEIGGMVDRPGNYGLDDLLSGIALEERIYRFRCVEAWSMVVPWIGFSLSEILNPEPPRRDARYWVEPTVPVALCRRFAHGRSDAPAVDDRNRHVRREPAKSKRCAVAIGGALEIWIQIHQVDCEDFGRGQRTADHME